MLKLQTLTVYTHSCRTRWKQPAAIDDDREARVRISRGRLCLCKLTDSGPTGRFFVAYSEDGHDGDTGVCPRTGRRSEYLLLSAAVPRRKRINRTHVRRQRFADALGRFTWSVSAQRTNDASHQCMYYGRQSKAAKSVLAFTKVFENRRLGDDHLSPGTRRIPLAKTALPSSKRNGNTESPDESRLVTRVEHAFQMFTDRDLTNAIYIYILRIRVATIQNRAYFSTDFRAFPTIFHGNSDWKTRVLSFVVSR